jgi:hypothetical protein
VEEGEVVVWFAVASGGDPAHRFQPGVGALDREPVACLRVGGALSLPPAAPDGAGWCAIGDRLPRPAGLADVRLDLSVAERLLQCRRGVAAVGPQLVGLDSLLTQCVDQRQQVPPLVFVARRQPDRER